MSRARCTPQQLFKNKRIEPGLCDLHRPGPITILSHCATAQQPLLLLLESSNDLIGHVHGVVHILDVVELLKAINQTLDLLGVGAGNLGRAITSHISFERHGFFLAGIFDNSPQKIGTFIHDVPVFDVAELEAFCKREKPVMAAICVPLSAAGRIADTLYSCGVRSFWNFTHYDIAMEYSDAIVENVHLNDSLMTLCYRISNPEQKASL